MEAVVFLTSSLLLSIASGYAFGFFQPNGLKLYRLVIVAIGLITASAEYRRTGYINLSYLVLTVLVFAVMGCSAEITSSLRSHRSKRIGK